MSILKETESATPVNAMSGGGIATFDPMLKLGTIKRKMLPSAQQFKIKTQFQSQPRRLRDIVGRDIENEKRSAKRK